MQTLARWSPPTSQRVGEAYLTRPARRRGAALAAVILSLTVMGALIAISLVIGVQETRVTDNARYSTRGFNVAEAGLAETLGQWKANQYDTLTPGDSSIIAATSTSGGTYAGAVRRVGQQIFLVRMTGTERSAASSQTRNIVYQIIHVHSPGILVKSAITIQGNVTVTGNTTISGKDSTPNATWTGCPSHTNLSGIQTPDASSVSVQGSGAVNGNPPVQQDTTINDNTFQVFGGTTFDSLASYADITLPTATYNGIGPVLNANNTCNESVNSNWGDPNHTLPCGGYYPLVHITGTGTTILNGGTGQGILLIDDNLKLTGGFVYNGIIVVQGAITVAGGSQVYGGVLAEDVNLTTDMFSGNSLIEYSSCAVQNAQHSAPVIRPLASRSWFAG